MNQHNKEDAGLGSNAQGGDPDPEPESKRIKRDDDVDDLNSQHIKENQVDDGSHKPMEDASETEDEYSSFDFLDSDWDDDSEPQMSAQDSFDLHIRQKWDHELAKKGINVKDFEYANWQGECEICGDVDRHPTRNCPYGDFI